MSKVNGNRYSELNFLNEDDPVKLLSSNNYLDQLVPIIKSSLRTNTIDDLIEKLRAEDGKKDDEIAVLLNENEGNIAFSALNIARVSKDASDISEQLLDINDHLARTSNLTIEKKFKLLELKKNISKINESEILINKVLQVLELTDRTQELINTNKFFNALKNLNDLTNLNKDFDRDFKFLNNINDSVPHLRNLIRDESISLMKRNLGSLDSKFEQFVNAFYVGYAGLVSEWANFKAKNKDFAQYKVNSSVERSLRSSYASSALPEVEQFINIGFIYDTFLVFKTLDQVEFFKDEFNKELIIRRDKLLYPFQINDPKNSNFQQLIKNEDNLRQFLGRTIGFLILHRLVSTKFPTLVRQNTNDLWENLSTKLYPYLKNLILNEILEVRRIIEIKEIIGNFDLILEHFQLSHDHFYNLLINLFKKYQQMLQFEFTKDFIKSTKEDDSMPMIVYDLKLYEKITGVGWYNTNKPNGEIKFPQILPFSSIYPIGCAKIRAHITQQQAFLKDYYKYELNLLFKLIIDNVDNTLISSINKYYNEKLDLITREELSQNLINLEYFLIMTKEISNLLTSTFEKEIILKSVSSFANTRKATESKLFELVDSKVDDLIDFLDWDWQTTITNQEPNYFIKDIGDFLKNMFNSTFSNLPFSVKTLLLYRVFDLLAKRFLEDLNNQSFLTEPSIANFDLDIDYIEGITQELSPSREEESKRDSNRASLQSMFLQLRQTINLLKSGDLDEYKDQSVRNRKYDQIKPDLAVSLINKLDKANPTAEVSAPSPTTASVASKYFMKFRSSSNNNSN